MEGKGEGETVTLNGVSYAALADGDYDVAILGTGLKECILGGLLQSQGMKVLQVDRNGYYGAESASLNLTNLFGKFGDTTSREELEKRLGLNRDYNVDLVPKFLMACGKLVKVLLHTKVTRYLEFQSIQGSYVANKSGSIYKVPATAIEAAKTSLVGFFQKRKLKNFLQYLEQYEADQPATHKGMDLNVVTMDEVYSKYGLDATTQDFVGHAMALHSDDSYKSRPAIETIEAIQLYAYSLSRYGTSPYIYPLYGLGGLPEGFSRLCAINGGTFMLNRSVDEVIYDADTNKVAGIKCGEEAARAKMVIGDPSYFPQEKLTKVGQVIRSICILNHPIPKLPANGNSSAQIIIPQKQVNRGHDIYVTCISAEHHVCAKGIWICLVSTTVETADPKAEVEPGIKLLGPVLERFDSVTDLHEPVSDGTDDQCFITSSYDSTSHFESVACEVLALYERITGSTLDMSINADTTEVDE